MKKTVLVILIFISGFQLLAQGIEDLTFGTDTTFEAVTWNLEWFPKKGQTTIDYVTQIIQALDVDVLAIQEIDNQSYFELMVESLDGWDGYYINSEYLALAYIYKTDVIEDLSIYEIYTNKWREFPRPPLVMEMNYKDDHYVIINNHLKCCGDGFLDHNDDWDEEKRRLDACNLLDQYIIDNYADERVIVLGDLNDILTDSPANNVFQVFIEDTNNYLFPDMDIAEGNSSNWSYPSWPSHLDHILITNKLFDEFENDGSDIQTIKIDEYLEGGFYEYDKYVSDHRPVGLKIKTSSNLGLDDITLLKSNLSNYPNPFNSKTTISFDPAMANTEVEIYNMKGQKIQHYKILNNQSSIVWNADSFPVGIYYAILIVDKNVRAVRKMVLIE